MACRLAVTPGETHDNRPAGKLPSRLDGPMLLGEGGYDANRIREVALKRGAWAKRPAEEPIAAIQSASAGTSTKPAT